MAGILKAHNRLTAHQIGLAGELAGPGYGGLDAGVHPPVAQARATAAAPIPQQGQDPAGGHRHHQGERQTQGREAHQGHQQHPGQGHGERVVERIGPGMTPGGGTANHQKASCRSSIRRRMLSGVPSTNSPPLLSAILRSAVGSYSPLLP